jgi:protein-S-isoprenylcysteine O-methyltransferase Ste14
MDKSIEPRSTYTFGLACFIAGLILLALNAIYYLGGWSTIPIGLGGIGIILVGIGLLLRTRGRK